MSAEPKSEFHHGNVKPTRRSRTVRSGSEVASYAAWIVVSLLGCYAILTRIPVVDAVLTIATAVAFGAAAAMSFSGRPSDITPSYLFSWTCGVLLGGAGLAVALLPPA